MIWGSWLDEYDREARLVPALLTILPLSLAAIGLGFEDNAILVSVIAVLLTVGVPMVVAKQVADRGRVIEAALFAKWGAPPTTLMLVTPTDGPVGEILRQRRARLEGGSGISLPTNPALADSAIETYQAAVRWLIENTRDHTKFPVVWAELKNYGFDRNTLGLANPGPGHLSPRRARAERRSNGRGSRRRRLRLAQRGARLGLHGGWTLVVASAERAPCAYGC